MNHRNLLLMAVAACVMGVWCAGDVAAQDPAGDAKAIEGLWRGSW